MSGHANVWFDIRGTLSMRILHISPTQLRAWECGWLPEPPARGHGRLGSGGTQQSAEAASRQAEKHVHKRQQDWR